MKQASISRRLMGRLAMLASALGLWGALVVLFSAPLVLTTPPVSLRQAVGFGVSFWALWLVFLPAVAWLSFRFPIERRRLVWNVGLHLVACLLVVGVSRAAFRSVSHSLVPPQRSEAPGRSTDPRSNKLGAPGAFDAFFRLRTALDVLVYASLVGVCQAVTNFRRSQERERRAAELEARLAKAQLQALRMQINPHFLFNALNSVAALVYESPRAADEMLGDLGDLLRRSLDSMEDQELSLGQELEFIGGYVRIEQRRFGERLRLEERVPDELRNALVPAFLLQPLVENAIRHGIEPRRSPGLISVEAALENQHLHLIVRDNGRGWPTPCPGSPERRGIGLSNTQARLRGLYGEDQTFSVGTAEPQGCRVDIRLPFHVQHVNTAAAANEASV